MDGYAAYVEGLMFVGCWSIVSEHLMGVGCSTLPHWLALDMSVRCGVGQVDVQASSDEQ